MARSSSSRTGGSAKTLVVMAYRRGGGIGISARSCARSDARRDAGKKKTSWACASDTSEVFQDCRLPAVRWLCQARVHGRPSGARAGRVGIAALSVGSQGAYGAARRYAGERRQFSHPISSFQAIQWKLADMATHIEAARPHLSRGVVEGRAAGGPHEGVDRCSTRARWPCVCRRKVQIHGGWFRGTTRPRNTSATKLCTIGEGTSRCSGSSSRANCQLG